MDDRSFQFILAFFRLSWPGYRRVKKGVKKRLSRHMREIACRSVSEYLEILAENQTEKKKAENLLTVSISRFYRDPEMWKGLETCLTKRWAEAAGQESNRPFRVWSAGCSCGEEIYSLKILWLQLKRRRPQLPPLALWGGDSNPKVLKRAEEGIYQRSSLRNLSAETLDETFTITSNNFTARAILRKDIHWLQHDFIRDPPPVSDFDLIFLRNNLLTYYLPPVMLPAFSKILTALNTGGFLVIGLKEIAPQDGLPLKPRPEHSCILEKTANFE